MDEETIKEIGIILLTPTLCKPNQHLTQVFTPDLSKCLELQFPCISGNTKNLLPATKQLTILFLHFHNKPESPISYYWKYFSWFFQVDLRTKLGFKNCKTYPSKDLLNQVLGNLNQCQKSNLFIKISYKNSSTHSGHNHLSKQWRHLIYVSIY